MAASLWDDRMGLLGKHIPETSVTRTIEIPAMETFLLAEPTASDRCRWLGQVRAKQIFQRRAPVQDP